MKTKLTIIPLLLCLSVLTAAVLTNRAAANTADSEHITFSEPVVVAGTLLEAKTYKLVWEGTGPQVQVSFMKGSKTVATASATIVLAESSYDGAVETKALADNSKVLEKITWKNKALVFRPSS